MSESTPVNTLGLISSVAGRACQNIRSGGPITTMILALEGKKFKIGEQL